MEERNYGLELLRLLCMLMLATYHFLNYYGNTYISITSYGTKAIVVQNILWGGGRMICNVFLFISAWFLCERKKFKIERVLKVWFTVLMYSIIIGTAFYLRVNNKNFLISHLFPIATNLVWYATMYIGILFLSPILNRLLQEQNRNITKRICAVFFMMVSIIPTFYPKFSRLGSVMSWYILAYLIIGLMKVYNFKLNRTISATLFLLGWSSCLWFFNNYDRLLANQSVADVLKRLGFYNSVYFSDLATLPCFLSALGLFYFFLQCDFKALRRIGGVFRIISIASLDVYIISSMESPSVKLAWVELVKPEFTAISLKQCYCMIILGVVIGIVSGNIREILWNKIIRINKNHKLLKNIDQRINEG